MVGSKRRWQLCWATIRAQAQAPRTGTGAHRAGGTPPNKQCDNDAAAGQRLHAFWCNLCLLARPPSNHRAPKAWCNLTWLPQCPPGFHDLGVAASIGPRRSFAINLRSPCSATRLQCTGTQLTCTGGLREAFWKPSSIAIVIWPCCLTRGPRYPCSATHILCPPIQSNSRARA